MSHKERVASLIQKLEGLQVGTQERADEIAKLQAEEWIQNAVNREQYKKTLEAQERVANEQYRIFQLCDRWIRSSLLGAGIDPGDD